MKVGAAPSPAPARVGVYAAYSQDDEVPSAEIKYEVIVHVKREGAAHKLKGLIPAKREK